MTGTRGGTWSEGDRITIECSPATSSEFPRSCFQIEVNHRDCITQNDYNHSIMSEAFRLSVLPSKELAMLKERVTCYPGMFFVCLFHHRILTLSHLSDWRNSDSDQMTRTSSCPYGFIGSWYSLSSKGSVEKFLQRWFSFDYLLPWRWRSWAWSLQKFCWSPDFQYHSSFLSLVRRCRLTTLVRRWHLPWWLLHRTSALLIWTQQQLSGEKPKEFKPGGEKLKLTAVVGCVSTARSWLVEVMRSKISDPRWDLKAGTSAMLKEKK